jgi:hypothetical protein
MSVWAVTFQLTLMQRASENGARRNFYFQAFIKNFLEVGLAVGVRQVLDAH